MPFHIRQPIQCIDDDWYPVEHVRFFQALPQKTKIYHVRTIEFQYGRGWVRLAEIVNPIQAGCDAEPAFATENFRPLQERKTSIAIFERMLDPLAIKRAKENV